MKQPTLLEWCILAVICAIAAIVLMGCDSYARATAAPDVTVIVNVPPAPQPTPVPSPSPAVPQSPTDNSQLPTPNSPPDADPTLPEAPSNPPNAPSSPPQATSPKPEGPSCEPLGNGRGGGTGAPGNDKGRGDEHRECAKP